MTAAQYTELPHSTLQTDSSREGGWCHWFRVTNETWNVTVWYSEVRLHVRSLFFLWLGGKLFHATSSSPPFFSKFQIWTKLFLLFLVLALSARFPCAIFRGCHFICIFFLSCRDDICVDYFSFFLFSLLGLAFHDHESVAAQNWHDNAYFHFHVQFSLQLNTQQGVAFTTPKSCCSTAKARYRI